MRGLGRLNVKRQIEPTLTADDWQLYTNSKNCDAAAIELNNQLAAAFNAGCPRPDVEAFVVQAMKKNKEFGAYDTEPCAVLADILDHLFPY
jgi:hypothetical protein